MKKVLYTTSFSELHGGGQVGLLLLLEKLDRTRFEPILFVPAEGAVAKRARELGVDVRVSPFPGWRSGALVAAGIWNLRMFLKDNRIALIHADVPRGAFYAVLASAALGIPVVWHIRSPFRDHLLDWFLERTTDRIILVARMLEDRFAASARGRIVVIYNGVDLSAVPAPDRASLPNARPPLLLCPARLDPDQKGQHHLLAALSRLPASCPKPTTWLVGGGDAEYEQKLKAQIADLKLADVHFLGFRADVRSLMTLADLVILPSLFEAFPRVVLEGMAAGKPVLATSVGGTPELLVDGETGLLVPPADEEALTRALSELLSDPVKLKRMGEAGLKRVQAFSAEAMVGSIESVYDQLLGAR